MTLEKQTPGGAGTPDRAKNAIKSAANNQDSIDIRAISKLFVLDVLPPTGNFCLWTKRDKGHHWFQSGDSMVDALFELFQNTPDTYYGTGSFGASVSPKTGGLARSQANVTGRKCLHGDIDCGPGKDYADKREAAIAVRAFEVATGLKFSYFVDSGGGLHVYLVLDQVIPRGEWDQLAHAFANLARKHGLLLDPACTEDSSRLLRLPGSLHRNGNRVRVVGKRAVTYSPEELAQRLQSTGHAAARKPTGINADVLTYDGPQPAPADFEIIRANCEAVRWAATPENQPDVSRDYWRGLLGIVKHCAGAGDLAHEVSKHHPEYEAETTETTLTGWEAGPTTCEYFSRFDGVNGGACTNCRHANGGAQ